MEVEIIDALDVAEAVDVEMGQESIDIIEKLGLTGQKSLLKRSTSADGEVETVERTPFRRATNLECWVYGVLCPEQTKLRDYSEDPIPHRVLERAAYAEQSEIFTKGLYVWHQAGAIKDPVLVAYDKDGWEWSRGRPYILARWGEELDELSTLAEKARKTVNKQIEAGLAKMQAEMEMLLQRARAGLLTDEELGMEAGSPRSVVSTLLR